MKKILGLDLGTNSIGWALIENDFTSKQGKILGMGSRIIPMSQDILGEFGKGNSISQTADRTSFRSTRRIRQRHLLRRERIHRVLNVLNFLPPHYANQIDFKVRLGQFLPETEPKIAYSSSINEKTAKYEFEFLFKDSFNEMLKDFKTNQPQILKDEKGEDKLIPYDWTIYYLRKKALSKKIEKEELAWILLNFNQKRGYYQLRGEEEEEKSNKQVEFYSLKVADVQADQSQKGKDEVWYSVILENGWIYRRASKIPLFDWKDKVRDFIVTTDLNEDGTPKKDKEGNIRRSFRAPGDDDWTLLKKKTESEIRKSEKTVGSYIYDTLLKNPSVKIKGKLVRTIEREFYKEELKAILDSQKNFHTELEDEGLYAACIRELYKNNEDHQFVLFKKDLIHLLIEDIIFYQRPLKSQKSLITKCTLEPPKLFKDANGNDQKQFINAAPKSHPLYQEFRLWQWISNLRIYKREDDTEVTSQFIQGIPDIENLFDFLNTKKEIKQEQLIKYLLEKTGLKGKALTNECNKYRWNYADDKEKTYPCNETRTLIISRLEKVEGITDKFINEETEEKLWHIIYSVTDKKEYEKALVTFAKKNGLHINSFVENFKKFPPFKSDYGSYSLKAIKKLLTLMRVGKYWKQEIIDKITKERINKIITGEYDETIKNKVREKAFVLTEESNFQGLPLWLVSYVVYNRHSEAAVAGKWNSASDLQDYIRNFKQHSLRNPIVEQVVTETLRVVKDIWEYYGNGEKDFFNEIHVELGREMKNPAEERKRITSQALENENTNFRMKALLAELKNDSGVKNVRPYSPPQQEILKIYEEGVLNSDIEIPEDILKISKTAQPSSSDLIRYKLWLDQKYQSPYTGEMIPLGKLFTSEYEIEHIIPQSRYFDDSLSNKVICESAINKLKDNQLGLEFIKNHKGEVVETGFGRKVKVFDEESYKDFIVRNYSRNRAKKTKLLLEDIPEKMIDRQINDTRYISKFISSVLSNIVREEKNDEGVNSKNIIPGNGKVTSVLKQDWGLNDVWNDLVLPRFERLNEITNSQSFTIYNEKYQKIIPAVPVEFSKGFQKKRIDHRHHALDALVIACATRDHVNLLNNKHAKSKERFDLNRKLRKFEKQIYVHLKTKEKIEKEVPKEFLKPWENFTIESKNALESIVVSFKKNLRVINKTVNHYAKWVTNNDGSLKKERTKQVKGDNWAIRKSLHKDTIAGLVELQFKKTVSLFNALDNWKMIVDKELRFLVKELIEKNLDKKKILNYFKENSEKYPSWNLSKVEVFYKDRTNVASRVIIDTSFNSSMIKCITDTGIQKIMLNHLKKYNEEKNGKTVEHPELAFSPEGIEEMNKNIIELNEGKKHQPIYKVRTFEPQGNKFRVGSTGNKVDKYVEAAKGTNLYFAVYESENGERSFGTIPFNIVIERLKNNCSPVPEIKESGERLKFYLSPNDLVYVPECDDKGNIIENFRNLNNSINKTRIYKMVSSTEAECHFIPQNIATSIIDIKEIKELGTNNKSERAWQKEIIEKGVIKGVMIKKVCIKIEVDRLGNIIPYKKKITINI